MGIVYQTVGYGYKSVPLCVKRVSPVKLPKQLTPKNAKFLQAIGLRLRRN